MLEEKKRTWAEIKLSAFRHNYEEIMRTLPDGCKFMAVVKANGYGHGAIAAASQVKDCKNVYLAVASVDEAELLRKEGISLPILILGHTTADFIVKAADLNVTQAVGSLEAAERYSEALQKQGKNIKIHIKLETGMGRTGFDVKNGDIGEVLAALKLPMLEAEGIFTHFAVSDEPEKESYTKKQFTNFIDAVSIIERDSGIKFPIKHCANSGAVINYPELALDMVRPGLAYYGIYPGMEKGQLSLEPAMELKSRIVEIHEHEAGECISYGCTYTTDRKTKIAVLPIGYADGLSRRLSGQIEVLIRGHRAKQVGRICMDMCMIDVTDIPDVQVYDVATIFGKDNQNGGKGIFVNELAEKSGTISYEILCGISNRVPRLYI